MEICVSIFINSMTLRYQSKKLLNFLKIFSFIEVFGLKLSEASNFSSMFFSSFVNAYGT